MNNKETIQNDLLPLALMFTILVYLLFIYPQQIMDSNKATKKLLQAKEFAVYYYHRADSMENAVVSLNDHIDKQDSIIISLEEKLNDPELAKLIKIKEDLRGYTTEEKATGYSVSN